MDDFKLDYYEKQYLNDVKSRFQFIETVIGRDNMEFDESDFNEVAIILQTQDVSSRARRQIGIKPDTKTGKVDTKEIISERHHPIPLPIALKEQPYVVLLGEPGAGKSTLLRLIAYGLATNNIFQFERQSVPVFVALRDVYKEIEENGLDFILNEKLNNTGLFNNRMICKKLIARWLGRGQLVILLDGLDEIPEDSRLTILEKIKSYTNKQCRIILTSRTETYKKDIGNPFHEYRILPLGRNEQIKYITYWLAVFRKVPLLNIDAILTNIGKEYLEKISSQPGLLHLIINPLYLQMIVYTIEKEGKLPDSWADTWNIYFEKVAWKRVKERVKDPPPKTIIFKTIEMVAWELQHNKELEFSNLIGQIKEHIKHEEDVADHQDVEGILDFLNEQMGILIYKTEGLTTYVKFSHEPFHEYFLALALNKQWIKDSNSAWETLKTRLHHPSWIEPILILSTMPDQDANQLIRLILNAKSPYEEILHRDVLLAGECIGRGAKINKELRKSIIKKLLLIYIDEMVHSINPIDRNVQMIREVGYEKENISYYVNEIFRSLQIEDKTFIAEILISNEIWKTSLKIFLECITSFPNVLLKGINYVRTRPVRNVFGIGLKYLIFFLLLPVHILLLPKHFADHFSKSRDYYIWKRNAAIKTLTELKLWPKVKTFERKILHYLGDENGKKYAAEALGRFGPDSEEVLNALLVTIDKNTTEYVGTYVQRYPHRFDTLIHYLGSIPPKPGIWGFYYYLTQAICKTSETLPEAIEFIFEVLNNPYRTKLWTFKTKEGIDQAVTEGVSDGFEKIRNLSYEVFQYLLDKVGKYDYEEIKDKDNEYILHALEKHVRNFRHIKNIFLQTGNNTPFIRIIHIAESGDINYEYIDISNEIIDLLQKKVHLYKMDELIIPLITTWGLTNIGLVSKFIKIILEADSLMLAQYLNNTFYGPWQIKKPLLRNFSSKLYKSIDKLINGNDEEKREEVKEWLQLSENLSQNINEEYSDYSYYLTNLGKKIQVRKWSFIFKAYKTAVSEISTLVHRTKPFINQIDPRVLSALSWFWGFKLFTVEWSHGYEFAETLNYDDYHDLLTEASSKAQKILQEFSSNVIDPLAPIIVGQYAACEKLDTYLQTFFNDELSLSEEKNEIISIKPDMSERVAAAFGLAKLANSFPSSQKTIRNYLEKNILDESQFLFTEDIENEYQHKMILEAFEYIEGIDKDLITTVFKLIERYKSSDEDDWNWIYFRMSSILRTTTDPKQSVGDVLVEYYPKLTSEKSDILRLLGEIGVPSNDILNVFREAINDESFIFRLRASESIGKLRIDDSYTIIELIEFLIQKFQQTPHVIVPISQLSDRLRLDLRKINQTTVEKLKVLLEMIATLTHTRLVSYTIGKDNDLLFSSPNRTIIPALSHVANTIDKLKVFLPPDDRKTKKITISRNIQKTVFVFLVIQAIIAPISTLLANLVSDYIYDLLDLTNYPGHALIIGATYISLTILDILLFIAIKRRNLDGLS